MINEYKVIVKIPEYFMVAVWFGFAGKEKKSWSGGFFLVRLKDWRLLLTVDDGLGESILTRRKVSIFILKREPAEDIDNIADVAVRQLKLKEKMVVLQL